MGTIPYKGGMLLLSYDIYTFKRKLLSLYVVYRNDSVDYEFDLDEEFYTDSIIQQMKEILGKNRTGKDMHDLPKQLYNVIVANGHEREMIITLKTHDGFTSDAASS